MKAKLKEIFYSMLFALFMLFIILGVKAIYNQANPITKSFSVTPDTKIDPNSELSKYVTQEEVDSFGFRYWDIDTYRVKDDPKMESFRHILKSKDTAKVLSFLKDNSLSVDTKLHYGVTPLMYASFYDDEDTAKELIRLGANLTQKDRYGLSPLAYAVENNSTKVAKLLLNNGVKFDEVEKRGVQVYLQALYYSWGFDKIVIDGDDIKLYYEGKSTQKHKHGFGDGNSAFGYILSHNFIEITSHILESGYRHTGYFKDCNKDSFQCSIYSSLVVSPNHEPMLELLLEHNVSGQPSKEFLKEQYKKCYSLYQWYKIRWIDEDKINKKRPFYVAMPIELLEQTCIDENKTFNNTKEYINYKNKQNLMNKLIDLGDTEKVIYKNPTDTIYNEIKTINSKEFVH